MLGNNATSASTVNVLSVIPLIKYVIALTLGASCPGNVSGIKLSSEIVYGTGTAINAQSILMNK